MSLFADDVLVELTPDEWDTFMRPINAEGGAQNLLRHLRDCVISRPHRIVRCEVHDLDRAYHYAYAYGGGGFQERFRAVIRAAIRTGKWTPDGVVERAKNSGGAFGRPR